MPRRVSSDEAAGLSVSDLDRDELVAAIREVFSQNIALDRDSAIRQIAHALGFARTGSRIANAIDSALIAAAKRGVIQNNRGALSLLSRNIGDYSRDELIDTLLSVMGAVWWEREEAIRVAARHLGFKRTGSLIRDAFKSAINGAIRRDILERDGNLIRRTRSPRS
jgi:NADH:ubiquinone oxidoreductase subunit E